MRAPMRMTVGGLAVVGGVILLRPGTRANRAARHQIEALGRQARYSLGQLQGVSYRLRGGHPDAEVSGNTLADRVRSTLGPLEKRLDLPHIHVMVEDHVALLHGEVATRAEAHEIEVTVSAIPGVRGVESYLHVGLTSGDTRPSAGRASEQPSEACRRLVSTATARGVDPNVAPSVVRAVLATFAERLPEGERDHVAHHLPADVRSQLTPPRRIYQPAPARTTADLVARITATTTALPAGKEIEVTAAIVHELRALVPDEAAGVAAVLPAELRRMWEQGQAPQ
ncbi:MAG TPA: DUF2267 domain-containing protein [Acidimicrobiales bacterium]|nr:DUF2267 domain-containing protein [Acidimicrobiales bacterium]